MTVRSAFTITEPLVGPVSITGVSREPSTSVSLASTSILTGEPATVAAESAPATGTSLTAVTPIEIVAGAEMAPPASVTVKVKLSGPL